MNANFDAVVIGAGIVGAACALELAQAGLHVAIVERNVVGGDATAAGMGHIVVLDDSPAQFALTRYSQILWAEMAPHLPIEAEYNRCGTLWLVADEQELMEAQRKCSAYRSAGVLAEILGSAELSKLEPAISKSLVGALLVPEDAVLDPPAATRFFIRRAQELGAVLYLGKTVQSAGQNRLVLDDGETFHAQHIVNATGASAATLTPGLPIRKRKGHLVLSGDHSGLCRHQLVELGYLKSASSAAGDSIAFNLQPRLSGQLLLGSSRQFTDDPAIDRAIVHAMVERAQRFLPALGPLSTSRARAGFRSATPDKLPLIGPVPHDRSVLVATGHEGFGITTSLATARLLGDYILRRTPAIPPEPYLPARFPMSVPA